MCILHRYQQHRRSIAVTAGTNIAISEQEDSLLFSIDDRHYVAWPSTTKISTGCENDDYLLASVIPRGSVTSYTAETLSDLIHTWTARDDVFTMDFLQAIIFEDRKAVEAVKEAELAELLRKWQTVHVGLAIASHESLVGGPHILHGKKLYQVRRLCYDTSTTLVCSLRQCNDKSFKLLDDGADSPFRSSVAMPSRSAVGPLQKSDLSGMRVVVKDIFDIEASSTASLIQQLVEAGVVILGKTKLSPFLTREEPSEAIDFPTAWNPRADGFQSPGGSSSGSAAAIAAYEWLDVAIGSDTNGSIRRPAQCCGVFGFRPSRGVFSSDGVFTVFDYFDVPGFLARDLRMLETFADHIYPEHLTTPNRLPISIVAPTDFWLDEMSKEQNSLIESFIIDLEKHTGAKAERISIAEEWHSNPPEQAHGEKLHDYLEKCGSSTFLYSNYWNSGKLFLDEFRNTYGDEEPNVSPFVRWRWDQGRRISKQEHEEGMHRLAVYSQWILNKVMKVDERFPILVMPSESVKPSYRDDPPPQYQVQPAWNQWWISSITGSPELCLPVGTVSYRSKVSNSLEELPCSVGIMGKPGSDLALIAYINDFMIAVGRTTKVQPGQHMFQRSASNSCFVLLDKK